MWEAQREWHSTWYASDGGWADGDEVTSGNIKKEDGQRRVHVKKGPDESKEQTD